MVTGTDGGALKALARRHGVQTTYLTADGAPRQVAPDVVAAVLGALGVDVAGPGGAAEAWRASEARRAGRVLPDVVVQRAGHGEPADVAVTVPTAGWPTRTGRSGSPGAWLTVTAEGGGRWRARLDEVLGPPLSTETVDGRTLAHHRVSLARLAELPLGYHRLTLEMGGATSSATVIVAPRHCPQPPRTWGLGAPLYALRGQDDWGTGTFTDLGDLADWAGSLGAGVTGTLPLYAAFLDGHDLDPSPYRPASRLAWNEVFVDLVSLPELTEVPGAAEAAASPEVRKVAAHLADRPLADLPAVARLKRRVLEPLALAVLGGSVMPARRRAFDCWAAAHPEAVAYARFRATGTTPPNGGTVDTDVRVDPASHRDVELATHCYAQWAADEQLSTLARRAPLYLDVPVGVHPRGFDPVWEPEAYVRLASVGAPPDLFFAGGQDWGLPPPHPEGTRRQGYRHFAAVLRRAMGRAAVVRLDHVMGLHRLWFVPEGAQATDGAYVSYRSEELRAVAVLEAHRAGAAVVGEDLGTVPDEVRRAMAADGMLRSAVWQFDASPEDPWPDPPAQSLASLATHDLPTFTTFLTAADAPAGGHRRDTDGHRVPDDELERRRALRVAVGPDVGTALQRCLLHLAAGPAEVVLVDLADLWLERTQQNVPGTSAGAGSFRLRARRSLQELRADERATALLRALTEARRTAVPVPPTEGRPPPGPVGAAPVEPGEER